MRREILWKSDMGDGTFKNPILFADYSDPDVIRVGNCYYMIASSFNYTPGLPILISRDLVNWELKNYAIKNIDYDKYKNPAHAQGIWAPAIRYHKGKFWIYYGMPDEGVFMINTEDALGKWSEPVLVLEGKGLIDPCPFWNEDGKAYIIHGYAKSRIGFKSILGIFPMSEDGMKAIGEDEFLYDGSKTQPTIEGPKVYKRDGLYYIFAPAGGVRSGWQTVLRSKNINGPYDEKIVMHQGNTSINGPHQGAWVNTPSNEDWFIHFQDRGLYGRIVHLQPLEWVNGWPLIGQNSDASGCGEPGLTYRKPSGNPICEPTYLQASDDFAEQELALQWQWIGNHNTEFYSLRERNGYLRLYSINPSGERQVTLWKSSNVLTQKIVCPSFQVEVKMNILGLADQEQAGLVIMGGQYAYMAVRKKGNKATLVYCEAKNEGDVREEEMQMSVPLAPGVFDVTLRFALSEEQDKTVVRMSYQMGDSSFTDTGFSFMPADHTWVGAKIGLFSLSLDNEEGHGYADFEYIKVEKCI